MTQDKSSSTITEVNRPEWFDYIRVRERRILGTRLPPDFVISFGPQNICTPEAGAEKAERIVERVKDWLWMFMQKGAEAKGFDWAILSVVDGKETDHIITYPTEAEACDWVARFPQSYRLLYRESAGQWLKAETLAE